jgi:hypothetical protein
VADGDKSGDSRMIALHEFLVSGLKFLVSELPGVCVELRPTRNQQLKSAIYEIIRAFARIIYKKRSLDFVNSGPDAKGLERQGDYYGRPANAT